MSIKLNGNSLARIQRGNRQVTSLLFTGDKHFTGTRHTTYPFKGNSNNSELYDIPFKGYNIDIDDGVVHFNGNDNSSCIWSMYSSKSIDMNIIMLAGCVNTPAIGFSRYNTKISEIEVASQLDVAIRIRNNIIEVKHDEFGSFTSTGVNVGEGERKIRISLRNNILSCSVGNTLSFELGTRKLYGSYYLFICRTSTTELAGDNYLMVDNMTLGPMYALGNDNLALDKLITINGINLTDEEMQDCDVNDGYRKGNLLRSTGTSIVPTNKVEFNYKALLDPDGVDITINTSAMDKQIRSAEVDESTSTVLRDGVMDNYIAMKFINLEEREGILSEIQTDREGAIHVCQDKDNYTSFNQLQPLALRAYLLNTHTYSMQPVKYNYLEREYIPDTWVGDQVYQKVFDGSIVRDLVQVGIWKYNGNNLMYGDDVLSIDYEGSDEEGHFYGVGRKELILEEDRFGASQVVGIAYACKVRVSDYQIRINYYLGSDLVEDSYNDFRAIPYYSEADVFITMHYPNNDYSNIPFYAVSKSYTPINDFTMNIDGNATPIRVVPSDGTYYVAIQFPDGNGYYPCGFWDEYTGIMTFFLFKATYSAHEKENTDVYYRFVIAETADNPFPTYTSTNLEPYYSDMYNAEQAIYGNIYDKYASGSSNGHTTPDTYSRINSTLNSFSGDFGLINRFDQAVRDLHDSCETDLNNLRSYHNAVSNYGIAESYSVKNHHLSIFQQYENNGYTKFRRVGPTRHTHKNAHKSSVIIETQGNLSVDNCCEVVKKDCSLYYPLNLNEYYRRDSEHYYKYYKLDAADSFQRKIVFDNNYSAAIVSFVADKIDTNNFNRTFISFTQGFDDSSNNIMLNTSSGSLGLMVDSNGSIRIYTSNTSYSYLKDLKGNQVYLTENNKVLISSYIATDAYIKANIYINDEYVNTIIAASSIGKSFGVSPKVEYTNMNNLRRINFYNAEFKAHETVIVSLKTKFDIASYDFNDTSDIQLIDKQYLGDGGYYYMFKVDITPYSISSSRSTNYSTLRFIDIQSAASNLSWSSSDPDVYEIAINHINTFSIAAGVYNGNGFISHLCLTEGMSSSVDSYILNRSKVIKKYNTDGLYLNKVYSSANITKTSINTNYDLKYTATSSAGSWNSYAVLSNAIDLSKINYLEISTPLTNNAALNAFELGLMTSSTYSSAADVILGMRVARDDKAIRWNRAGSLSSTGYNIDTDNKLTVRIENTGSSYRARIYRNTTSGRSSASSYVTLNTSVIYIVAVLKAANCYINQPQLKIDYKDE